jgi:nucleoside-diphosphate-sugar epimerase
VENNRFLKKMRIKKIIAITGMSGFVGQNLNTYLEDNYQIQSISRNPSQREWTYDGFLKDSFEYDSIVHLAGKAHDLKKTSGESEYFEVNFELIKKLYHQFLSSNATQFIYISSVKAVADTVESVLTEEAIPNPITAYGKSKLMAENYILENLPSDKKVYILRPCMIHGPGNKGNLNLLYALVSKGIPYPLGAYDNQRSFLSVVNLCFIIESLLKNDFPSGVYNVSDDGAVSTTELIELMAQSLGKKPQIWNIKKSIIGSFAKIGDVLPLPINTERLQKLTENYVVSNHKIKSELGIDLPLSSKDGLLKTFESFKK